MRSRNGGQDEPTSRDELLVTAALLIRRQLAADLPDVIDLDDVAAGYDDYLDELATAM